MAQLYFLDPYQPRASVVHRCDPRVKATLALAFILAVALTPSGAWPIYLLLFALALAVVILSELGVSRVYRRALIVLPFALVALPMLFSVTGTPLLNMDLGPLSLMVTREGAARFANIVLKSWLSVQMAVVLVGSTPFPALLAALRALRVPRLLVAIVGLMWRYLFVLVDEALRLLRARESRSAHSPKPTAGRRVGGSLVWRGRVAGGMVGNLFLRAFDRADRIYAAMLSRGYDGETRTLPLPPLHALEWGVLLAGLGVLVLLAVSGLLFYY